MVKGFKGSAQPKKHPGFAGAILKGVLISLCVSVFLVLILSAAILTIDGLNIDNYIRYIMVAVTMASIFIGGVYAAKKNKTSGLLVGMTVGLLYVLISLAIGLEVTNDSVTFLTTANKFFAGLAAGALGGLVGVNL